ncbi:MAG: P-loop NTPase [Tepidiformaceae bacterium]
MARVPQVIVVDPDRESAAEVAKLLSDVGFNVSASTGYGVEAYTLAQQLRPDIVLMRVEEPLVRPVQTLTGLSEGIPDLPVVVYSSQANARLMRQAMVAGATDFLIEPLRDEEVEVSVMRALERKERESQRAKGEVNAVVPHGTIITIFGAKGGIGKTTIASNLAVALATEAHQSVALVDMDTRFGDVAITMDIEVDKSIADLARNLDTVDRSTLNEYLVEHESGVHILPAPRRPSDWRNLTAHHIRDVIDVLAQTHDFVILDTPGTFNEVVATAIEVGTMILLITTLDMASIKDTGLALEMLRERFGSDDDRIKVILNRAGQDMGVNEKDVEQTLEAPIWWKIPHDNEVVKAAQLGRPIVMTRPNSRVSTEIREMSRSLAGVSVRQAAPKKRGGFAKIIWPFFRKSA